MKGIEKIMKRKMVAIVACSAFVLTLGTVTAIASTNEELNLNTKMSEDIVVFEENNGDQVCRRNSDNCLLGINSDEEVDGNNVRLQRRNRRGKDGNCTEEGQKKCLNIIEKVENGIKMYSIDGGETWSEDLPERMPNCRLNNQ